ncbi:hypothetical protein ASE95_01635 [Sphingomonas sp. Leaf231]|uniref:hypothetical protein n=1 Tax=Sphingomonas sp. Leaf231 TaxID=1736301 RepID=UPI0006FA51F9|nr:hypothetical protein [Sphingomonas sp. Leaf231]KQN93662.1 hypothetical protein ASE95_01635 [Sphingomonas sp. Leaf231]
MTKKKQQKSRAVAAHDSRRTTAIVAASAFGAIVAAVGAAAGMGWFDRFLPARNAEHEVPDLAADAPTPGTTRAPDAFRPDPTAAVPASERDGLRPATGPGPSLSATRGEMANQTGVGNG